MAFELKEGAQFCIRTLDEKPDFKVKIGRFDTLNDLKAKIYYMNGYPQNYQRFIFGEMTQLNNGVIIDQMDIIQTELLSFGDLGSISSEDGFQPLLYFIPIMTGGNNIYHKPKWIIRSPSANISPDCSDDRHHHKESGIESAATNSLMETSNEWLRRWRASPGRDLEKARGLAVNA